MKLTTIIFILAVGIRLITVLPGSSPPVADAAVYDGLAVSLSQGHGYVDANNEPHSFYPPLYPVFLSIIYKIFGHNRNMAVIFQSIIGGLACVLTYLIGRKLYSRQAGILAAFISAVYLPFIKSAGLLLTELFFTFILLLIIFYLLKAKEAKAGYKDCIILGLLLTAALLTKSAMALFPLFILYFFINMKENKLSFDAKKYLIVFLFSVLSMLPWVIRNYSIYHKFHQDVALGNCYG